MTFFLSFFSNLLLLLLLLLLLFFFIFILRCNFICQETFFTQLDCRWRWERPDQKQIRASQRDKHTDRLYIYIYTYIYIERRSERAKLSVYIIPPTERGRSQVSWEELCCRGSRSCQKGEGEKSKITRSRKKRVAVTKTQEGTQKKNER